MDMYVYYRVRAENAPSLCAQAQGMQRCLSREYGIVSALKRRPEAQDGRQTWMEVYEAVPKDFDVILERAVTQAGLGALIDGARHTEHFLDVTSCV